MKTIEIETNIKNSIENLLRDMSRELIEKGITFDIELNRNGNEEEYFSEVEVTFWQEDNVLDVISVIMYSQGKLRDTPESFLNWFNGEVKCIVG
jgi:hypothetical protein